MRPCIRTLDEIVSLLPLILFVLITLPVFGCGRASHSQVVSGTVTCDKKLVEKGEIRFVIVDGTKGPDSYAPIVDGHYEIKARGGVPIAKHRVEIRAFRKTGRKVVGKPPFAETKVDEFVPLGLPSYGMESSPLIADVGAIRSGSVNFDIPSK